jgi:dTMP kinase
LSVLRTREPGGTPGAEALRDLLLDGRVEWSLQAETLLHFAARAEHVERAIRPALAAGTWVVCDRFSDSTMAYQGYGSGEDRGRIAALAAMIGIVPALTIVLEVSEPVAAERMRARAKQLDRYERKDAAFHERVREGFRAIARTAPRRCVLLDADDPPEEVHAAVMAAVERRLGVGKASSRA